MYCSKCGAMVSDAATFCSACGQPTGSAGGTQTQAGVLPPPPQPAVAATATALYAGFWLRVVAFVIDVIILSFAGGILGAVLALIGLAGGVFHSPVSLGGFPRPETVAPGMLAAVAFFELLVFVGQWLYFALLESSAWQATLGKKALGLYVTDLAGGQIGFGRATGRYFAKIISSLTIFIGYIMAGFTERKQALHDMIANCLVLRKA